MKILIYFCILLSITWKIPGVNTEPIFTLPRKSRAAIQPQRKLIAEPECEDLKAYCDHLSADDDLAVLECIQSLQSSQLESLSEKCEHTIWIHSRDILRDDNVFKIVAKPCAKYSTIFEECKPANQIGFYLSCLVGKLDDLNELGLCREEIQRLEKVAFTDYRLVTNLINDCKKDIELLGCGKTVMDREKLSQGEILMCLQDNVGSLKLVCRRRILDISRQQAKNLDLDHQFFLGCKKDAMRLCPDERSGASAVFNCLVKLKNSPKLSVKCREQVVRRDKLVGRDYKISGGLAAACHKDIRVNHCRRGVSEDKDVKLSQILLCLESVVKNGTAITDKCQTQINDHRRMLMMDYNLSPEILTGCTDEIPKFCGEVDSQNAAGGGIIHCLMRNHGLITPTCQRALEQIAKAADVGEDWRVDPTVRQACKPVVDIACRDTEGGDARVLSCLMDHVGTKMMTTTCESALRSIEYFIARDFKLDPQLYRNCRDDAIKYCNAKRIWDDSNTGQMDPERGPLILPCLHKIAYNTSRNEQLRKECLQEVKRVMRQRAISVALIPEVEEKCIADLQNFCLRKTENGAEMQCLQDNLEQLQPQCKQAVSSYTEDEAAHIELNPVIMAVCHDAMEKHCDHVLKTNRDEGDMMDCLISHKNDADLRQDNKCRAAIEHFQIITLKRYQFTYKFKKACHPYVTRFCPTSSTKNDVVACLSEVMRNDTIKGHRHTIPKECRQQVKSQLYQQRENIMFDPKLKTACKKEIQDLCPKEMGSGEALECLQANSVHLGDSCRHAIFFVKKSELDDSSTDYTLLNTCKQMTYKYCQNKEPSKLLDCLKLYKDEPMFDPRCHLVVVNRMIEQNTDFRFNPVLQSACGKNIDQHCSHIVATAKPNEELNGKVINCLKGKFREAKLDHTCELKMIEILQEQALNYKLNPLLQSFCKSEIQVLCKPTNEIEEHGEVEECLKNAFLNQRIVSKECKIEVATLIQEAKADIHVDPLLQRACTVDLLKYCSNVKSGNGRQLKCLQTILQDESKAMEEDCKNKLLKRMEMFRNAETLLSLPPENMEQLLSQVASSPANKFFLVVMLSVVGMVFIIGMFFGRVTKRAIAMKIK